MKLFDATFEMQAPGWRADALFRVVSVVDADAIGFIPPASIEELPMGARDQLYGFPAGRGALFKMPLVKLRVAE